MNNGSAITSKLDEASADVSNSSGTEFDVKRALPCRICQKKATGSHYGVISCEGCKAFFKRNIMHQSKFRCFFGDDCHIGQQTRGRCKACRLKKCFDEGMSLGTSRMGRLPKSKTNSGETEQQDLMQLSDLSTSSDVDYCSILPRSNREVSLRAEHSEISSHLIHYLSDGIANSRMCHSLSPSIEDSWSTDDVRLPGFLRRYANAKRGMGSCLEDTTLTTITNIRMICEDQLRPSLDFMKKAIAFGSIPPEYCCDDPQKVFSVMPDRISRHTKNLTAIVSSLPGLDVLSESSQKELISKKWLEYWLLLHSVLVDGEELYSLMGSSRIHLSRYWMDKTGREGASQFMFSVMHQIQDLGLTMNEIMMLIGLRLVTEDRNCETQNPFMGLLRTHYRDAFVNLIRASRTQEQYYEVMEKLERFSDRLVIVGIWNEKMMKMQLTNLNREIQHA